MADNEQVEKEQNEELEEEQLEDLDDEVEQSKMPLTEHLEELRKRLFYSILAIFGLAVIAFVFIDPIFAIVQKPFQATVKISVPVNEVGDLQEKIVRNLDALSCESNQTDDCLNAAEIESIGSMVGLMMKMLSGLIFTHPVEGFFTFLKLALYSALLVGMPFLLVQAWRFIVPALYPNEKGFFRYFLVFGSGLFYTGVVFCYNLVLPIGIAFLVGFGGELLTPLFSIGNYISFSMLLMLVFGLSFEVPLVMFILVKMGLVERQVFFSYWKHILVGAVVVGAIFTPPDPWTQLLMGGAVVVLYGVGLLITKFAVPKNANELDEELSEPT